MCDITNRHDYRKRDILYPNSSIYQRYSFFANKSDYSLIFHNTKTRYPRYPADMYHLNGTIKMKYDKKIQRPVIKFYEKHRDLMYFWINENKVICFYDENDKTLWLPTLVLLKHPNPIWEWPAAIGELMHPSFIWEEL